MKVIIYSTTTCSFCHTLTTWLDKQDIAYTIKMTDEDDAAMAEFMTVNDGQLGVPFTVIENGTGEQAKIMGFDQRKLKQALGVD